MHMSEFGPAGVIPHPTHNSGLELNIGWQDSVEKLFASIPGRILTGTPAICNKHRSLENRINICPAFFLESSQEILRTSQILMPNPWPRFERSNVIVDSHRSKG